MMNNTFQKEYRNKILIFLIFITIAMVTLSNMVLDFVYKEVMDPKLNTFIGDKTLDVLYMVISFWSFFISILLGVNTVKSDFETGVISSLLSFPQKRCEYLLSRVLGTWIIVISYYLFSYFFALALFSLSSGRFMGSPAIIGALGTTSLVTLTIICISILYSLFAPKLMAFVLTMATTFGMLLSNSLFAGKSFSELFEYFSFFKIVGLVFHLLLPQIGRLGELTNTILLDRPWPTDLTFVGVHFVITFTLLLGALLFLFQKRDIS